MEINSPFTMIVFIVLIAVGAGVIKTWLETKSNATSDTETRARLDDMDAEVQRLRERVRVLEKIATDSDTRLSDEIRRLA